MKNIVCLECKCILLHTKSTQTLKTKHTFEALANLYLVF